MNGEERRGHPGTQPGAARTGWPAASGPAMNPMRNAASRTDRHDPPMVKSGNGNGGKGTMATGQNENGPGAPRRKFRLSGAAVSTLAGALMGLMGTVIFFTRGLYAFQHEADDLGIGYMVLAAAFPAVMALVGWLMGRNADPKEEESD